MPRAPSEYKALGLGGRLKMLDVQGRRSYRVPVGLSGDLPTFVPIVTPEPRMAQATKTAPSVGNDDLVIVDVGKYRRKQIKRFRRGEGGRVMDEVTTAIQDLRAAGTISADAETVVVVVRERPRSPKLPGMWT
jgi:hypothetical protein